MEIRQLARMAGVSIATVSRAFNTNGRIHPDTRKLVLDLARKVGFTPNVHARRLSTRQSGVIGLYYRMSDDSVFDYFHLELVQALTQAASATGYSIQVELSPAQLHQEDRMLQLAANGGVDGMLVVSDGEESTRKFIGKLGRCPSLVISNAFWKRYPASGFVHLNFRSGVQKALAELSRNGHRRIGFIRGIADASKLAAYYDFLENHRLESDPRWVIGGEGQFTDGARAGLTLAKSGVTAILAASDILALGAISALAEVGLRVPDYLSVMGMDNLSFTGFTQPSLSSVGATSGEVARAAVLSLVESIKDLRQEKPRRRYLHSINTTFFPRGSTGRAPKSR